jgi:hypothetical protein
MTASGSISTKLKVRMTSPQLGVKLECLDGISLQLTGRQAAIMGT